LDELLEIVMRRYERASTVVTSNRPVEDWDKMLGDSSAVTAMLDRLLHHGHVLKCGPRSWRTKNDLPNQAKQVSMRWTSIRSGDAVSRPGCGPSLLGHPDKSFFAGTS
jgi:hypothetical protein